MDDVVQSLKRDMRAAVLRYRTSVENADYSCGRNLAAYLNPEVCEAARRVNNVAEQLRKLDPDFPKSWQPLPEGV